MVPVQNKHIPTTFFYVLLMLYTILNTVWLVLDNSPPISDSIYYIEGSQKLLQAIQDDGLTGFLTVPQLVEYRPPLQSMLGAIALYCIGPEPDQVLFLNVIWMSLSVWVLFILLQRLVSPFAGLLASIFLMTNSFLHGYLPMFETEVPMMTVVIASFLCLERIWTHQSVAYSILLGLLLSAGMLLKWIFFVILAAPVSVILIFIYLDSKKNTGNPKTVNVWGLLSSILLIPTLIALPWYISQWGNLLAYQSEVSQVNFYTPFVSGWDWTALFYYPKLLALKLHWVHSAVLLLGIICFTVNSRGSFSRPQQRMLWLILSSILFYWLFFALNTSNLPQKYLLPLQPIIALLLGLMLVQVPRWFTNWGWLPVLAALGIVYAYNQWGFFVKSQTVFEGGHSQQWLEPQTGFFEYPKRPPLNLNVPLKAISADIAEAHGDAKDSVFVTTIPWLDRFSSFDLRVWLNMYYSMVESKGITKYSVIYNLLFHDFIITSSGPSHREMTHRDRVDPYRYNNTLVISRSLLHEPDWFKESHKLLNTYEYKDRGEILRLYQRTKPVDENEVQYVAGLLTEGLLPHPYYFDQMELLWGELGNAEMLNRSQLLKQAYLNGENKAIEQLTNLLKENALDLFPYERLALYRLIDEKDMSTFGIMNAGPVLGWQPITDEIQDQLPERGEQLPFQAYPVIPYPREVVSGYFYPQMNCVSGEFLERGERLLAMAPAAGNDDPISTLRLFEMTDINFIESTSIIRQLQPLEDVPTNGNQNHGVFLSAGDVDGDGLDELIAGQSASETSVGAFSILDFNKDEYEPKRNNFVGFPPGFRGKGNVRVVAADLDGDGTKELVAAADGNGFHLCAIQLNVANQSIQRFVRPTNGVVHVQPLNDWNADDPVYITAGEFDGNPENGEEILFGLDKPDTTYRIVKIQYKQKVDGTSEVQGINLLQ